MAKQKEEIYEGVKEFYKERISKVGSGGSSCCGPGKTAATGLAPLIGYSDEDLESIPNEAAGASFGCGNPLAFSEVQEGQTVLDLGSGAGIDCFLASKKVGESGRVIGLDMTKEMIDEARLNAEKGGYTNVEFVQGRNEEMPVESSSVDWVISNCVINLSPEKDRVFAETFRVLKPGGRLLISDMVAENIPDSLKEDLVSWAGCVAGAVSEDTYLQLIRDAGFEDVAVVDRADFRKSQEPGSLRISSIRVGALKAGGSTETPKESKLTQGVLDVETQLLVAIGSAVAAGCVPCLETLVAKAHTEGIDEKKLRAAAMTGQFVKDKPAAQMKALSDRLLGTHLVSAADKGSACCPPEVGEAAGTSPEVGAKATGGGCGCS
jgi:AhpD family alkylhydroperoxidase